MASLAEDSGTPPISKSMLPGRITATQPSTAPLPLPIRVSGGREVIDLCGKMRIQTLPFRLSDRLIAIRQASIWRLVIHPRSRVCRPKSPKATVVPLWAFPDGFGTINCGVCWDDGRRLDLHRGHRRDHLGHRDLHGHRGPGVCRGLLRPFCLPSTSRR